MKIINLRGAYGRRGKSHRFFELGVGGGALGTDRRGSDKSDYHRVGRCRLIFKIAGWTFVAADLSAVLPDQLGCPFLGVFDSLCLWFCSV